VERELRVGSIPTFGTWRRPHACARSRGYTLIQNPGAP
jgi:hypothetical protein